MHMNTINKEGVQWDWMIIYKKYNNYMYIIKPLILLSIENFGMSGELSYWPLD